MVNTFIEAAHNHNSSVDHFINVELVKHFGGDKITADQWFEAQRLINEQDFYNKGHVILKVLRSYGIDCKMDMQSNKLHCAAYNVRAY